MFAVNDAVAFVGRGNRAVAARVEEAPGAGVRYARVRVTFAPRRSGYRAGDLVGVAVEGLTRMDLPPRGVPPLPVR
jgi:hypothetical protein